MAYEPLSQDLSQSAQTQAYLMIYEKLANGDAVGARQAFAGLIGKFGDDALALFHLQRLLEGKTSIRIEMAEK